MKLTKAQQTALEILGTGYVEFDTWGSKLMTSLPKGIRTRATLWRLYELGLIKGQQLGASTVRYTITDAGHTALQEKGERG